MTRKDYEQFASLIRNEKACPPSAWGTDPAALAVHEVTLIRMATRMLQLFQADNARFDVERFAEACGMDPSLIEGA